MVQSHRAVYRRCHSHILPCWSTPSIIMVVFHIVVSHYNHSAVVVSCRLLHFSRGNAARCYNISWGNWSGLKKCDAACAIAHYFSTSEFFSVWNSLNRCCVFFWTDWTRVAVYKKIFHSSSTCKLVCSITVFEHIDLIWDLFSWLHAHNEGSYAASAEWLCEIQLSV